MCLIRILWGLPEVSFGPYKSFSVILLLVLYWSTDWSGKGKIILVLSAKWLNLPYFSLRVREE